MNELTVEQVDHLTTIYHSLERDEEFDWMEPIEAALKLAGATPGLVKSVLEVFDKYKYCYTEVELRLFKCWGDKGYTWEQVEQWKQDLFAKRTEERRIAREKRLQSNDPIEAALAKAHREIYTPQVLHSLTFGDHALLGINAWLPQESNDE